METSLRDAAASDADAPPPVGVDEPVAASAADPEADVLSSPEGQRARLELDARQKEAEARLDAIRRELGVDGPTDPEGPTDGTGPDGPQP